MDRLSIKLSVINLLDLHNINTMHLCEEHGITKMDLSRTDEEILTLMN